MLTVTRFRANQKARRKFAKTFERLMDEAGLNCNAINEKMKPLNVNVYRYAKGERFPSRESLKRLARILKVKMHDLLEDLNLVDN